MIKRKAYKLQQEAKHSRKEMWLECTEQLSRHNLHDNDKHHLLI